ncbi:PIN domain-containing protein [Xanthobacter sp. KR7-65]|uniref:PIN domain-containing protein n=1 Tax=Xanthobacter sp. KR7-65 TaxID=3156612 RepID=UPI0032B608B6
MILLDTNVVSEAMKPEPHPGVRDWLDAQVAETLFLSSVTIAELMFGIGALATGERRSALARALDGVLEVFGERILAFDLEAARAYAALADKARGAGKGFPTPDGYIAAIAAAHGFAVASRDTSAFMAAELPVINPWTAGGTS